MKNSIFVLLIVLGACKADNNRVFEKGFDSLQKELNFTLESGYCLVISFGGCSSCRSKALKFLETNHSHKNIVYILSAKQKRLIQFSVKKELLSMPNVLIDTKYNVHSLGLISDFPMLYYFKDKHIEQVKALSATNIDEELHLLEIRLKNKL